MGPLQGHDPPLPREGRPCLQPSTIPGPWACGSVGGVMPPGPPESWRAAGFCYLEGGLSEAVVAHSLKLGLRAWDSRTLLGYLL